jgi:hypothetical protein
MSPGLNRERSPESLGAPSQANVTAFRSAGVFRRSISLAIIKLGAAKQLKRLEKMKDLNQFAISKVLGSKIKQVGPVAFGGFSAVSTTEEIKKGLRGDVAAVLPPSFTYEQDAVVVQAFEDVRRPASCPNTRTSSSSRWSDSAIDMVCQSTKS